MNFGIMQGRLTPSRGRGIQFFPFGEWQGEFYKSKELGLQEIEWIFDDEDYAENPLWTVDGCRQIKAVIAETDIKVHAICFDYFMRKSFYKQLGSYEDNIHFFRQVIEGMQRIGASLIEIPMVDDSAVCSVEEREGALHIVREMADIAAGTGIRVGLETDMPPEGFLNFLQAVGRDNVYANYDSGNSSGLGYSPAKEMEVLGSYITNIHIKDRVLHGTTVALGSGSADFEQLFSSLAKTAYNGSFILQAARGEDGQEQENIRSQLKFVRDYLAKYPIGV